MALHWDGSPVLSPLLFLSARPQAVTTSQHEAFCPLDQPLHCCVPIFFLVFFPLWRAADDHAEPVSWYKSYATLKSHAQEASGCSPAVWGILSADYLCVVQLRSGTTPWKSHLTTSSSLQIQITHPLPLLRRKWFLLIFSQDSAFAGFTFREKVSFSFACVREKKALWLPSDFTLAFFSRPPILVQLLCTGLAGTQPSLLSFVESTINPARGEQLNGL